MKLDKIDFVITWVDGNDKEWQKEKDKYSPDKKTDSRNIRYRDWEILKYWFRGVEKFAPWVNKIYFVTCGHVPDWLNTENEKIVCVKHSDYIPKEYLPTFSSHPIELNLHRIKNLSEQFVYFNDDMFITNNVKPSDFFVKGVPCEIGVFSPVIAEDPLFVSILNNNVVLVNKHFTKKEIVKKNLFKYLNIKYGKNNLRTLLCLPWPKILGFYDPHHGSSILKSTMETLWEKEYDLLNETCLNKFRSKNDVNQYIFKHWQFCTGNFHPVKSHKKFVRILDDVDRACNLIESKKYKMLCLNDSTSDCDFEEAKKRIIDSFEKILPDKCSFEK